MRSLDRPAKRQDRTVPVLALSKQEAANSVRNAFMPLQAIYRWALRRELARIDPTNGVELPLDR
jgi:hypothetical protein